MMSETKPCPFMGEVCSCDMDDTWDLPVPEDCPHVCEEDGDDYDFGYSVDHDGSDRQEE